MNTKYFEKWKITYTNHYKLIIITDLELKRSYYHQNDKSNQIKNIGGFLNWFYSNNLDRYMNHENYELTNEDKEYIAKNEGFPNFYN